MTKTTDGEKLAVKHHDPSEAAAVDAEHHPVADLPQPLGPPTAGRGTRSNSEEGKATQVERINPESRRPPGLHDVESYAPLDHPENVRWPYRLTRRAFTRDHAVREPGEIVWLLPHEVASFHRLDRARLKELRGADAAESG